MRPILFSAPMVQALLAGTKTQTRRRCQGQRELSNAFDFSVSRCPYGRPGDQLWVRETWSAPHALDHLPPRLITPSARIHYAATEDRGGLLWRPSIHMPRWASRMTLKLIDVHAERLQDVSQGDAMAEGCPYQNMANGNDPRKWLAGVWDDINGPGSWEANPWVWVLSFRKTKP